MLEAQTDCTQPLQEDEHDRVPAACSSLQRPAAPAQPTGTAARAAAAAAPHLTLQFLTLMPLWPLSCAMPSTSLKVTSSPSCSSRGHRRAGAAQLPECVPMRCCVKALVGGH